MFQKEGDKTRAKEPQQQQQKKTHTNDIHDLRENTREFLFTFIIHPFPLINNLSRSIHAHMNSYTHTYMIANVKVYLLSPSRTFLMN